MINSTDVVIVGAGLAGLACAQRLTRAGIDVVIREASDAVGGRVRTDVIDGDRCDRGFQLINPAVQAGQHQVEVFQGGLLVGDVSSRLTLRRKRALSLSIAFVSGTKCGALRRVRRWGRRFPGVGFGVFGGIS